MEKIWDFLYQTKEKIDDIDKIFRFDFERDDCISNPFVSRGRKTYIWVEKLKKKL